MILGLGPILDNTNAGPKISPPPPPKGRGAYPGMNCLYNKLGITYIQYVICNIILWNVMLIIGLACVYGNFLHINFYRIRLKGGHAPPPFWGSGKIFGSAFKSNVQNGPKSRKSCLYLKRYDSYWNVNFYHIRLKRGHAPSLFLGGGWKNFWSLILK